jgi:hypothetical protein
MFLQVCSATLLCGYCETFSDTCLLELPTAFAALCSHLSVVLVLTFNLKVGVSCDELNRESAVYQFGT